MTISVISDNQRNTLIDEQNSAAKRLECKVFKVLKERSPNLIGEVVSVSAHANQGGVGLVFDVLNNSGGQFILKVAQELSGIRGDGRSVHAGYQKELWISSQITGNAAPPEIFAVDKTFLDDDSDSPYAFILQKYVPCPPAYEGLSSKNNILVFVEAVGSIARRIHSVSVSGFGDCFCISERAFSLPTWSHNIDSILTDSSLQVWAEESGFDSNEKRILAQRLKELRLRDCKAQLFHGDFITNWGNILVEAGTHNIRNIIDWECAGGGDALVVDLGVALCTLFERGLDEDFITSFVQSFLRGYGLSNEVYEKEFKRDSETFSAIRAINRLRRSDSVDDAVQKKLKRLIFFVISR